MSHSIAPLGDREVAPVVTLITDRQADPASHVVYLGTDPVGVAGELAAYDAWRDRMLVATDELGVVRGVLLADIDEQMRRVWWVGPFTQDPDDSTLAGALLDEGLRRFGHLVDEQELAPDERNVRLSGLAAARGFELATPSAVLSLELHGPPDGPDEVAQTRTLPLRDDDRDEVAALHDALFPGTHTTGASLVHKDGTAVRVAHVEDRVAGYIASEVQPDGTGYIDFLGVAEDVRRVGLARSLIRDAVADMAARDVPSVHLTVRVDNPGARSLYASLGFTEERVIAPYRLGFEVP